MKRLAIAAAAFALAGAGCVLPGLDDIVTDVNPFPKPEPASFALEAGLAMTIRPTYLGVTGTVSDVLDRDDGKREATVEAIEGDRIALAWRSGDASGSVEAERGTETHRMLLPAFWPEGEHDAGENALIWLSEEAYAEIKAEGRTEWELGVADPLLGRAADALSTFRDAARKLFGESETGGATPFTVSLAQSGSFPLRVDGRIEPVEVLFLDGWLADYVVLDDLENPLVLKVNVDAVALGALDAFSPLGVDPRAVGYEITAVARP